jgi:hypothetical protein
MSNRRSCTEFPRHVDLLQIETPKFINFGMEYTTSNDSYDLFGTNYCHIILIEPWSELPEKIDICRGTSSEIIYYTPCSHFRNKDDTRTRRYGVDPHLISALGKYNDDKTLRLILSPDLPNLLKLESLNINTLEESEVVDPLSKWCKHPAIELIGSFVYKALTFSNFYAKYLPGRTIELIINYKFPILIEDVRIELEHYFIM